MMNSDTIGAAFAGMPSRMMGVMDHMSAVQTSMSEMEKFMRKQEYFTFVGSRMNRSGKHNFRTKKVNRLALSRKAKLKRRNAR